MYFLVKMLFFSNLNIDIFLFEILIFWGYVVCFCIQTD